MSNIVGATSIEIVDRQGFPRDPDSGHGERLRVSLKVTPAQSLAIAPSGPFYIWMNVENLNHATQHHDDPNPDLRLHHFMCEDEIEFDSDGTVATATPGQMQAVLDGIIANPQTFYNDIKSVNDTLDPMEPGGNHNGPLQFFEEDPNKYPIRWGLVQATLALAQDGIKATQSQVIVQLLQLRDENLTEALEDPEPSVPCYSMITSCDTDGVLYNVSMTAVIHS